MSAGAWATMIFASAIFYGGFVYYTLIALGIDPKTFHLRILKAMNPDTLKGLWNRDKQTRLYMIGGAGFALFILILSVALIGSTPPSDAGDVKNVIGEALQEENETFYIAESVLDESGPALRGSPAGMSTTLLPFTMREDGKYLAVNLTSPNGREGTDYDMSVYSPSGKNMGTSAGADYNEQVVVDVRGKNRTLEAGEWQVEIVFFTFTIGTTWEVEAVIMYESTVSEAEPTDVMYV
ncbi:MAG: hypothetical protein KAT70_04555 [Thermoplasmata archaeon]|nr:hypothetical protein [Thermoplasmata archaeon]